jgi:hypothetical protein
MIYARSVILFYFINKFTKACENNHYKMENAAVPNSVGRVQKFDSFLFSSLELMKIKRENHLVNSARN